MRLKSGATAIRRAASCSLTIASKRIDLYLHSDTVDVPDQPRQQRKSFPSTSSWILSRTSRAFVKLKRSYNLSAPKGVNGRNSDNELIKKTLGWEPDLPLRKGMGKTYAWIYDEMTKGK